MLIGERFFPESLLVEVISHRALSLVAGRDGRDRDPELIGGISELATVATDLGFVGLAARLTKLVAVCRGGHCRDLERAWLAIVCEV